MSGANFGDKKKSNKYTQILMLCTCLTADNLKFPRLNKFKEQKKLQRYKMQY